MEIFFSALYYILILLYFYIVIVSVGVVLLDNRDPGKAIAWIVCIVLLPVVGLVFYYFFGRNYRFNKIFSRHGLNKIKAKPEFAVDFKKLAISDMPKHIQKSAHLLYKNSNAHLYKDSKIDILTDGEKAFEQLFEDIENARHHIHIEFYIIEDDKIGNKLRKLLIRKAQEKVKIRIIYDYLGGFRLSDAYKKSLQNAGIFIVSFLPFNRKFGNKINYRNHRKIVVIDGKVGYTGGINVADRYVWGNRLGTWRDTSVRIEGPAAHGLQNVFISDWYFADSKLLTDEKYFPTPNIFSSNMTQIVNSGPDTDWEAILQGIITTFSNARKNIFIHTPYFLPPESLMTTLEIAALSGVDVRLMLPKRSDTFVASAASSTYFIKLMNAGVKVLYYKKNFLHSKAITIDDEIGIVGTANMDIRSFEQNYEVNAFVYDRDIAVNLRQAFENDAVNCEELSIELWKNRTLWTQFKESFARLFSPLL